MQGKIKRKGLNVIISAPSGVGKSTIINQLLDSEKNVGTLSYSVSVTTRPKRANEKAGEHYNFITIEEFYKLINDNAFLEYAEVFGNFYGTIKADVEKKLVVGKDLLFDLDWQGANNVKQAMPNDTITIFLLPPSIAELERRIRWRALDKEDVILHRMAKSRSEISHCYEYDYIVVNDELDHAFQEIQSIILANRLMREKFLNLEEFVKNL
jgi:guanylate kinase